MKKLFAVTFGALIFAAINLFGQTDEADYSVVRRGANDRVWERTEMEYNSTGDMVPKKHRYTELATGLNHMVDGEWVPSSEDIEVAPDGDSAAATNGQHQVYFPGNIRKGIQVVTPSGNALWSQPLALGYFDGTKSILLSELANASGEILSSGNQVIYPNAFARLGADVVYTYTLSGFEQDVVLRKQLPDPASLGLNPATTRLQMFTEFVDPPEPHKKVRLKGNQSQGGLTDTTLDFGGMEMGPGQAFSTTDSLRLQVTRGRFNRGRPVYKTWVHVAGRTFLIEELPYDDAVAMSQKLPPGQGKSGKQQGASLGQVWPGKLARNETKPGLMRMASTDAKSGEAVVLDYFLVNNSQTNSTFTGDGTYLISGPCVLSGTTTIEGGAVIKLDGTNSSALQIDGPLDCKTGPYRPAVFTDKNDDSVGEAITTNSITPVTQTNGYYLRLTGDTNYTVKNLRFSYAQTGLWLDEPSDYSVDVWDCQFVSCQTGASISATNDAMFHNVLFGLCGTATSFGGGSALNGEQVTISGVSLWNTNATAPTAINLTNSIVVGSVGSGPSFNTNNVVINPGGTIFQTVGAGNYYLTNNTYHAIGTTNITPALLTELRQKTTRPPLVYSWEWIDSNLTLSQAVARDTNAAHVDLGYHYDTLDYYFDGFNVLFSGTLTLNNGVQLGFCGPFYIEPGTALNSQGKADQLNRLVQCRTVQETATNWSSDPTLSSDSVYYPTTVNFRFTDFSRLAGPGGHISDDYKGWIWNFRDCQFHGAQVSFMANNYPLIVGMTNCLLDNTKFYAGGTNLTLRAYNNLFYQEDVWLGSSYAPNNFTFRDNFFCRNSLTNEITSGTLTYDHNGYVTNYTQLGTGTGDVAVTNFTFESSWLGDFYQPVDSPMIDQGYTNANVLGLYHYTTQTNQAKEYSSMADIGYHYVATDSSGKPIDSNGDGNQDYLQDANGNGIRDGSETQWAVAPTIVTQPTNQTAIVGDMTSFSVAATGTSPLHYQWFFNDTNLIYEATNATLVFTNVSPIDIGEYSVLVSNTAGVVTSSIAILEIEPAPVPGGVEALEAWWSAESNALDNTGLNPEGIIEGAFFSFTEGEVGSAFNFGGQSDVHVIVSSNMDVGGGGNGLTVECWIKPVYTNQIRNYSIVESDFPGPGSPVFGLMTSIYSANDLYAYFADTNGEWHAVATSDGGIVDTNEFCHVAVTYDPASSNAVLYCNGSAVAAQNIGRFTLKRCHDWYIGYSDSWKMDFRGAVDEVSIYNRALTSSEIALIYNDGYLGKAPLSAYLLSGITNQITNFTSIGGTITLYANAGGAQPLNYQWYRTGNILVGETNSILTLTNIQTSDAGAYSVIVGNYLGSVTNTNIEVVVSMNPVIVVQPTNQVVFYQANASFGVSVVGSLPLSYQWRFNGTNIAAATNSTLLLTDIQYSQSGEYDVTVTNLYGAATSSNALLIVTSLATNTLADSDYDGRNDSQEFGDGTDPLDPNSVLQVELGCWRFDDTNTWSGSEGQSPSGATGLVGVVGIITNAVCIDNTNGAILQYQEINTNGDANLNCRNGSFKIWFKPDWSSVNEGGSGPGSYGRLFEVGSSDSAISNIMPLSVDFPAYQTNDWWALYLTPDGNNLVFSSISNGNYSTMCVGNISWVSNQWHQITLTYSTNSSGLYVDFKLVTNGLGVAYYPNPVERSHGFRIGSDINGTSQARGIFDELETFNYPLLPEQISYTNTSSEANSYVRGGEFPSPANVVGGNGWRTGSGGGNPPCLPKYSQWKPYQYPSIIDSFCVPEPGVVGESMTVSGFIFGQSGMLYAEQVGMVCQDFPLYVYALWPPADPTIWWSSYSTPSQTTTTSKYITAQFGAIAITYSPAEVGDDIFQIYVVSTTKAPFAYTATPNIEPIIIPFLVLPDEELAHWSFDDDFMSSDGGQLPLDQNNVSSVPAPFGRGIKCDSEDDVDLDYSAYQSDVVSVTESDGSVLSSTGTPNLRRNQGTVSFWLKPNWASGSGPANGVMFDMVNANWTLKVTGDGQTIELDSAGTALVHVDNLNWMNPVIWHKIVATYSASATVLYVDGVQVATGSGISQTKCNNLSTFRVGSDGGQNQVHGIIDELKTYNYVLSSGQILDDYNYDCSIDADGDGVSDLTEFENGTDPSDPPAQGGGGDNTPTDPNGPAIQLLEPINATGPY